MDRIRDIARAGLSLRKAHNRRVRLPLSSLTVVGSDLAGFDAFDDIVSDELNVKAVAWVEHSPEAESTFGVARNIQVNARALGPRLGKDVQTVIAQVKAGNWSFVDGGVAVAGQLLVEGEYDTVLDLADESTAVEFLSEGGFVLLDTEVTEELEQEGLARDLIRAIQQERKNRGLDVSDRISLTVTAGQVVIDAVSAHQELICEETLTTALASHVSDDTHPVSLSDGHTVKVEVEVT
jgi:isoleucyl-tRNA synthetase